MTMPDPPKKGASIPSWQQSYDPDAVSVNKTTETTDGSSSTAHDELLEHAREFLKDESIKDAPRDQKVSFLQSKGVSDDNIEKLLGTETDHQELRTIHDTSEAREEKRAQEGTEQTGENTATPSTATTMNAPPQEERPPEMPPIITYPEFLLKPQKPPPLITVSRLVNAAYALAGVSALTWGASKFLVKPMLESLTEARHDLAEGTLQDLEQLNKKLESSVSHIPYIAPAATLKKQHEQEFEDDAESIDSDPTELFHRDIATQTSPGLSRSPSGLSDTQGKADDATASQASRLASLHAQLASLAQSTNQAVDKNTALSDTIKNFQTQLDSLESAYSTFAHNNFSSIGNLYSDSIKDATKNATSTQNPEATKFKAEIRSLKGAFLSSRNFPTAPRPTATAGYSPR